MLGKQREFELLCARQFCRLTNWQTSFDDGLEFGKDFKEEKIMSKLYDQEIYTNNFNNKYFF